MKKFFSALLVLAMLLGMTACSSSNNKPSNDTPSEPKEPAQESESSGGDAAPETKDEHEPVTLRVYVRYSDDDTILPYDYAAECLKEAMPWVTLDLDPMPADDAVKLKTYAATGDMPDIFGISGEDTIRSLVDAGAIAELTDEVTANGFLEKVMPAAHSKLYFGDGSIYTLPYTGSEVALLFVNKTVFEENGVAIPTTIQEWIDASAALSAKGVGVLPIFAKEQWICNALYDAIVTRYIPDGLGSLHSGAHSIREEGFLQAAKDIEALAAAGAFPAGVTTLNYEQATNLFYNGDSAMFFNGQWEIASSDGAPAGLSVCAYSENYDTAVEVACFLAEKYAEYNYTKRGATNIAVRCDKPMEVEQSPMNKKLSEYLEKATSTTVLGGSGSNMELFTVLGEGTQSLLAGVMTAEEFIDSIALVTGD